MPSYWDKPGSRNTNNSSKNNQPEEIPQSSEMTVQGGGIPQAQGQGAISALTAKVEEQFVIDPFAADINPGSSRGLKLFIEACAPLEDSKKLKASVENQHIIMQKIAGLARKFRWGVQILAVPLTSDLTVTKSILAENRELSIDDFKLQAYKIWGKGVDSDTSIPSNSNGREELELVTQKITSASSEDEKRIFYSRVRSTMIRRAIEGHFEEKTLEMIRLQRRDYEWRDPKTGEIDEDGATMLKVLVDYMKPSVRADLKEFKSIITRAEAKLYDSNPVKMVTAMESAYHEITVKQGGSFDSFIDELFRAPKTFPNKIFTDYIVRLEDDYESEPGSKVTDKEINQMTRDVKNKYNNMYHNKTWNYVDPSDAKILALTTSLEEVKQELVDEKAKNTGPATSGNDRKKQSTLDKRRYKYVGQKTTIDGVDYEWCDKGRKSRTSNGLYMPAGHGHEKWLERKLKFKKGNGTASAHTTTTSTSSDSESKDGPKMILSEKLRAALVTSQSYSQDEADALINSIN